MSFRDPGASPEEGPHPAVADEPGELAPAMAEAAAIEAVLTVATEPVPPGILAELLEWVPVGGAVGGASRTATANARCRGFSPCAPGQVTMRTQCGTLSREQREVFGVLDALLGPSVIARLVLDAYQAVRTATAIGCRIDIALRLADRFLGHGCGGFGQP